MIGDILRNDGSNVGGANPGIMARWYGQLLIMKHALFTAMLARTALNRFRLAPALEVGIDSGTNQVAVARALRSLWAEAAAGVYNRIGRLA